MKHSESVLLGNQKICELELKTRYFNTNNTQKALLTDLS